MKFYCNITCMQLQYNNRIDCLNDLELQTLLDSCTSLREVLSKLGYKIETGPVFKMLKIRIKNSNLSLTKLKINPKAIRRRLVDSEVFIENSKAFRGCVKKRLIKDNTLPYFCSICLNSGIHNGAPLNLQLDHINGINNDNRLENLRFLCPNCHSQTPTFSGRQGKFPDSFCSCGNKKNRNSKTCKACFHLSRKAKPGKTKISWPTPEVISDEVWKFPLISLAKKYNVSGNAVKGFCKRNNIPLPPQGFFLRRNVLNLDGQNIPVAPKVEVL